MRQACATRRRSGFTVLEVIIASGLMALLALFASKAWSGFVRPAADTIARCKIAQEARLAQASLIKDQSGSLPNSTGTVSYLKWVGRQQPSNSQLWLCFDGNSNGVADWGANSGDVIITYQLQGTDLVRWDQSANTTYTVARNVSGMTVQDRGGGEFQIQLTFSYRAIIKTYTLIAKDPS